MPPLETPELDKHFIAKDFTLLSIEGVNYSISSVRKEKGLVVAFICNHCPYVQAIADKIAKEAKSLAEIGIGFVGINSNDVEAYPEDSYENMKAFASKHGFTFPYLFDETQEIAKAYGAVCTPDFFGFDCDLKLQYRGRLDSAGKQDIPDAKRELFEAMEIISRSEHLTIRQHPSIGCSIKWKAI